MAERWTPPAAAGLTFHQHWQHVGFNGQSGARTLTLAGTWPRGPCRLPPSATMAEPPVMKTDREAGRWVWPTLTREATTILGGSLDVVTGHPSAAAS